ncbi:MAG: CHAP domain-containing protein [Acidimicrobiales bacterium]
MGHTRSQIVGLALSQLGTVESPPNSNRQKYGEWYGWNGQPWCAQYLSWVLAYGQNASGYRFASTAASVSWSRQTGRSIPPGAVQPGDVVVHLFTSTTGHTGMATAARSGDRLRTAEGNTSTTNDRDGGMVMHRDRALSWWHYGIRLDYPAPSQEVPPMFGPFTITNAVGSAKDPATGGVWLVASDGAVFAFEGARGVRGVNGQSFFAGRKAVGFDRDANGFAVAPAGKVCTVIASSGERYDLPF